MIDDGKHDFIQCYELLTARFLGVFAPNKFPREVETRQFPVF